MDLQKIYSDDNKILTAFAESRIGGRPENQDSYGWKDTRLGYVITICDGMGGGPGGKTASTIAVKEIIGGIAEASKDEEISNIIIKAIRRANMAIIEASNDSARLKGMGSTATVLLLSEHSAFIAHVGDSRVYQLRGHKKIFRTYDHSMVFEMVAQGVITEEQARLSAQSNVITRALGVTPDVRVDIQEVSYEKGDRFMLCTDGIHGALSEEQLLKMVTNKDSKLGIIIDDVATYVDNLGRSAGGGHDNLTLAIIETHINSKLRPKMSTQIKFIMIGLVALFLISLSLNVVQCNGSGRDGGKETADSTAIFKDSIEHKTDTIRDLKQSMKKIDVQIAHITVQNLNSSLDSVKKITKNNK